MGNIDITCTGKIRSMDTLVKPVQRLVKQRNLRLGVWEEGMRIVVCPRGYLDFAWTKEKGLFGQWNLRCGCNTTPVGPGFHKAALELLEELGGLGIKEWNVQDRSDYQQDRDFGALRREWFLPWLEEQVSQVLEKTAPGEMGYLFWEVDQYRPEVVPDTIATPLGRFPVAWLKEKLEKGALEELAQYLFLWDQPGMNALYLRNRALKQLWEDCCFAPSDRSYQDRQINADILDTLERSAAMDPSLPQPVADYRELCILDDRTPSMPEDVPEMEELYPIGYRRGEVLQPYDKLVVPLPGCTTTSGPTVVWTALERSGGMRRARAPFGISLRCAAGWDRHSLRWTWPSCRMSAPSSWRADKPIGAGRRCPPRRKTTICSTACPVKRWREIRCLLLPSPISTRNTGRISMTAWSG